MDEGALLAWEGRHPCTESLLRKIENREIDPSFVITHRVSLDEGPAMYKTFRDKEDGSIKVVMRLGMTSASLSNGSNQDTEQVL